MDIIIEHAVEYTDMAKYAKAVMTANGVDNVVKVIQGAVEEIELPSDDDLNLEDGPIDIIISEW